MENGSDEGVLAKNEHKLDGVMCDFVCNFAMHKTL